MEDGGAKEEFGHIGGTAYCHGNNLGVQNHLLEALFFHIGCDFSVKSRQLLEPAWCHYLAQGRIGSTWAAVTAQRSHGPSPLQPIYPLETVQAARVPLIMTINQLHAYKVNKSVICIYMKVLYVKRHVGS